MEPFESRGVSLNIFEVPQGLNDGDQVLVQIDFGEEPHQTTAVYLGLKRIPNQVHAQEMVEAGHITATNTPVPFFRLNEPVPGEKTGRTEYSIAEIARWKKIEE